MSKRVQHRGVQANPRQGQILHIEDWAERPAAPGGLCRECFRTLETEDELEAGYCLKDLNRSKTWLGMWRCPKYNDKINAAACTFRRRSVPDAKYGGTACADCANNPDNDPLAVARGVLIGLLIMVVATVMAWGGYQLFVWLR